MLQFGASLLTMLAKARIVNYDHNCSFIVLATVIMIVNYDHHLFIVQATEGGGEQSRYIKRARVTRQETLTEGEGSVQLTYLH